MALSAFYGSLTQPGTTGNQAITGVGFTPKVVFFYGNARTSDGSAANSTFAFGAGVTSTVRASTSQENKNANTGSANGIGISNALCYEIVNNAGTISAKADFVSQDADGFTINWTTADATARIVNYLCLGGSDLTNAAIGAVATPASTGNNATTGVGFKPDCALFFTTRNTAAPSNGAASMTGGFGFAVSTTKRAFTAQRISGTANPTSEKSAQTTSKAIEFITTADLVVADFVSFDSDGFTLNYTAVDAGSDPFFYLALKGGRYSVGSFNQKASTGSQATTGVGFAPKAIIFSSSNQVTTSGVVANMRQSLGMGVDSTHRGSIWHGGRDNVATTIESQNLDRANIIKMMTENGASPSTQAAADLTSLDSDGFTLNWGTADATTREIIYLAIGSSAVVTGVSFITYRPPWRS